MHNKIISTISNESRNIFLVVCNVGGWASLQQRRPHQPLLLPLLGAVLLHVRRELGLLLGRLLEVGVVPPEVRPESGRLFEGLGTF